jgi:hypothetical protein
LDQNHLAGGGAPLLAPGQSSTFHQTTSRVNLPVDRGFCQQFVSKTDFFAVSRWK